GVGSRAGASLRAATCRPPKPPVMTRIMTPLLIPFLLLRGMVAAQAPSDQRLDRFKTEVARAIDAKAAFAQQMVDQVFSFGELGMQEVETSKYLSAILERNGFALERGVAGIPTAWVARWGWGKPVTALGSGIDGVPRGSAKPEAGAQEGETSKYLSAILERNGFALERGVAGIPTAWVARWGSGKPVIALGSDIDCIPQASQKPGVASHEAIIEGAPGHGEGHNSGVPL